MSEDDLITLVDEEGNEKDYRILFTFHSDDYQRSYVLIVPNETADDEEVSVEAYAYTSEDDSEEIGTLEEIESDEEWDMVEEVLNTFLSDPDMQ
ncbi:MAG: DUF1292 domain-containing protein [Aerococcus sp.]|nr:DUF1292 domain-containing protein [Aerococcus sp.]